MRKDSKVFCSVGSGLATYSLTEYLLRDFQVRYSKDLEPNSPFSSYLKEATFRSGIPFLAGLVVVEGTNYLLDKYFPEKEQGTSNRKNWTDRVTTSKKPSDQASSHVQEQASPSL